MASCITSPPFVQIARVQTPDAVFIVHEVGPVFRMVRLNSKHPEDPDPQYWGDSIGWYENGDTLVVDTIGTNGKTWLDQSGHPSTDKLHLIERFKRVDKDHLQLDMTIDDLGAYTKPFDTHRSFVISQVSFLQNPWVCSVRENLGGTIHLLQQARQRLPVSSLAGAGEPTKTSGVGWAWLRVEAS